MIKQMKLSKKHFESILYGYQIGREKSIEGSNFIFHCVNLLDCKSHNVNLNCGGLYINSPHWLKSKKTLINPINNVDK